MPPPSSADGRRSSSATVSGSSAAAVTATAVSTVAALSASTSNSSPSLPRTKALADAVAGVIASLVSLWCFYPFEIWKLQAQTASSTLTSIAGQKQQQRQQRLDVDDDDIILDLQSTLVPTPPPPPPIREDQSIPVKAAVSSLSLSEQLAHYRLSKWSSLFAGLVPKSLHAAVSSFCYFYLYSWIVAMYQQYRIQRQRRRLLQRGVSMTASISTFAAADASTPTQMATKNIAPTTRLLLSALAALINTFLTLPMDVISTQYQLQGSGTGGKAPQGSTTDDEDDNGTETYIFYDASGSSDEEDESIASLYNSQQQQQQFGFSMDESILSNDDGDERRDENQANDERQKLDRDNDDDKYPQAAFRHSGQAIGTAHTITSALLRFRSYWKGLLPSLLLCSNPAIHFTVYDVTKAWYLSSSQKLTPKQSSQKQRLGLIESFLLGLVAKFVATMATYPLIQAKVRLMSSLHNDTVPTGHTSSSGSDSSNGRTNPTLWSCLCHDFNDAGLAGLYRGCHLQLLHTLLKTALVMMLRERIEHSTRQWLLMPTPVPSPMMVAIPTGAKQTSS